MEVQEWVDMVLAEPGAEFEINPLEKNMNLVSLQTYISGGFSYMREQAKSPKERAEIDNMRRRIVIKRDGAKLILTAKPDGFNRSLLKRRGSGAHMVVDGYAKSHKVEQPEPIAGSVFDIMEFATKFQTFYESAKENEEMVVVYDNYLTGADKQAIHDFLESSESFKCVVDRNKITVRRVA